ncbi:MAG: hypothetical protein PUK83_00385 [Clostridia bacterium]|nr:hypothetical protein [Clostridia bacterium]MDY5263899.1 hypothetical protein [Eubacteriales bacterium]
MNITLAPLRRKTIKLKNDNLTLQYNILRGRENIGENLIEIISGKTKILIELGKALTDDNSLSSLEQTVIATIYDAVIVSHYHANHAGIIKHKSDCPIYVGNNACRILDTINEYQNHPKTQRKNIKLIPI